MCKLRVQILNLIVDLSQKDDENVIDRSPDVSDVDQVCIFYNVFINNITG